MTDTLQSGAESALDLDRLEALARAATPGPWQWVNPKNDKPRQAGEWSASLRTVEEFPTHSMGNLPKFIIDAAEMSGKSMDADADFIAAANPAVVLDLIALARRAAAPHAAQPELTVWYGPMPESNGKSNFTAILMRKGGDHWDNMTDGITIDVSEYPERVRYEADRVRYLIGEMAERPFILDYDADKHSGYVVPAVGGALVAEVEQQQGHVLPPFAAPASQHEAGVSVLTDDRIIALACAEVVNDFETQDMLDFARAIEAELASRGRAQGGNTQTNSANSLATQPTGNAEQGEQQ